MHGVQYVRRNTCSHAFHRPATDRVCATSTAAICSAAWAPRACPQWPLCWHRGQHTFWMDIQTKHRHTVTITVRIHVISFILYVMLNLPYLGLARSAQYTEASTPYLLMVWSYISRCLNRGVRDAEHKKPFIELALIYGECIRYVWQHTSLLYSFVWKIVLEI